MTLNTLPQIETSPVAPTTQPRAGKRSSKLKSAAEFFVLATLGVLLLEGFFTLAGIGQQEFLQPDPQLGCRHIPGKVVTWRLEGFSNDQLSQSGLRDVEHSVLKQPGVTRIALLGDSAAEGMQVPLPETFAKVLERNLNARGQKCEVINFACSSYSTGQQLLQYERDVRQYKPDVVMLLYNRGDSIENVFVPSGGVLSQPRPYFYLDENNQPQLDSAVLQACSSKLKPNPVMEFVRSHSRIFGVLTETNLVLSLNEQKYRKLASFWTKVMGAFDKNDRPSTWVVPYGKQDADLVTASLIDKLNKDVQGDGGKFLVLMFPNSVHDPNFAHQEKLFREMAQKEKFGFCDLTLPFFNADTKSLFLEYHFSSKGHAYVAQLIEPFVRELISFK